MINDENMAPCKQSAVKRLNKPLMERRRRQRINNCLDELKSILETLSKNENSYLSKLEKADILELTVQCIRNLKRRQQADSDESASTTTEKSYKLGYDACVAEVVQCLRAQQSQGDTAVQPTVISGLLDHLAAKRRCNLPVSETSQLSLAPVNANRIWPNCSNQLEPDQQMAALGIRVTSSSGDLYRMPSRSDVTTTSYSHEKISQPPSLSTTTPLCDSGLSLTGAADCSRLFPPSSSEQFPHRTASASCTTVDFGGRFRYSDRSSSDVAVIHDSDRLRRRVCRPSGTPDCRPSGTTDSGVLNSTTSALLDKQRFSSDLVTTSSTSFRGCLAADEVTSTVWNENDRHCSKSGTPSLSSKFGDVVQPMYGVVDAFSSPFVGAIETADSVKCASMWRPW